MAFDSLHRHDQGHVLVSWQPATDLIANSYHLGKYIHGTTVTSQDEGFGGSGGEEAEVPAEVEEIIGGSLESLQDKVRHTPQTILPRG